MDYEDYLTRVEAITVQRRLQPDAKRPSCREEFWGYCCEQWFLQGPRAFPEVQISLQRALMVARG